MIKAESKSAIRFRHWLMANPQITGAYEMKDTRGLATFPLREWKDAQRNFAEAIRYGKKGVLIRTEGVEGLPDYVYLRNAPSWVVIKFPKGMAIISSDVLINVKAKSLTWDQARDIATIVF